MNRGARVWLAVAFCTLVAACGSPPSDPAPPPAETTPAGARPASAPAPDAAALAAAIRNGIVTAAPTLPKATAADLERFYQALADAPAWTDAAGRPTTSAQQAQALVSAARHHGLDPEDYGASRIASTAHTATAAATPTPEAIAAFDVALSAGALQFLRELHIGRVDPSTLGLQLQVPAERHDPAAALRAARDTGQLSTLDTELAPHVAEYGRLKEALATYRALAATVPASATPLGADDGQPPSAEAIDELLRHVGDLAMAHDAPVDDMTRRAAIERFQDRHGLTVDGNVGPATTRALRVPLAARVRQIELALERLRWLPDTEDRRVVVINIPMFRLTAWDRGPRAASPAVSMRVIVGRALDTRTPVFTGDLRYVVFRPYWNVPASILANELLPAIRRDASYLEQERLEIVEGSRDSSPVLAPTPENIQRLGTGAVRLRQRPGPTNALGLMKFMFPNQNDVYMHSTPAQALFGRTRRDFSHGCIRVEDPARLAAWVLGPLPEWTPDAIAAAMDGTNNVRANVPDAIFVMIVYTTAAIDPETNTIKFAEDVYGLDPRLDRALVRGEQRTP